MKTNKENHKVLVCFMVSIYIILSILSFFVIFDFEEYEVEEIKEYELSKYNWIEHIIYDDECVCTESIEMMPLIPEGSYILGTSGGCACVVTSTKTRLRLDL